MATEKIWTDEEIATEIAKINAMDHESMASMYRNSDIGHPYFNSSLPFWKVFEKRFYEKFGGFNSTVSKNIGWDNIIKKVN